MFARIMAALIAVITTVTGGVWGAYRSLHASAISLVLWAIAVSVLALPLNYFDTTRWINGVIGIIAVIAVAAIATSPRLALLLLGSGVVASPSTPRAGIATVAEVWARFVGTVVLYLSVFFLVASTIEFSRNWVVLPALYLALLIVFLVGPLWGWQTRWAKPLVYGYALVVLIVGFGAMIPGATYVHWIGVDPYAYLGTSPVSEKLYQIQQLQGEKERMDSLKRLGDIQRKIEAGGEDNALTPEDKEFLRSLSVGGNVAQKATEVVKDTGKVVGGWFAKSPDPNTSQADFQPREVIHTGFLVKVGDRVSVSTTAPVIYGSGKYLIQDRIILEITREGELTFEAADKGGKLTFQKV